MVLTTLKHEKPVVQCVAWNKRGTIKSQEIHDLGWFYMWPGCTPTRLKADLGTSVVSTCFRATDFKLSGMGYITDRKDSCWTSWVGSWMLKFCGSFCLKSASFVWKDTASCQFHPCHQAAGGAKWKEKWGPIDGGTRKPSKWEKDPVLMGNGVILILM